MQLLSWINSPNNIAICLNILPINELCSLIYYKNYNYNNNKIYLKSNCDEYSNQFYSSYLHSTEYNINSNSGSEQDPEDEDFVQKTINNNNLITVELKHQFSQERKLNLVNLKVTPVSPLYNFFI